MPGCGNGVLSSGGADDVLSKEEWGGGTGRGLSLRSMKAGPNSISATAPIGLGPGSAAAGLETWYHLARFTTATTGALVNGVEVGVQLTNKSISISPQPLRIGRGPLPRIVDSTARLMKWRYFDMALTAADLQAVIDLGRAGKGLAK